jgi:hypothetical protein
MIRALRSRTLLAAAAVTLLAACDSTPTVAPVEPAAEAALGTFTAQVAGTGSAVVLAGSADADRNTDGADFTGTFQTNPIGRDGASGHFFTMIRLRSADGGGLLLGHVAPNADLPNGDYGIEPGRDLRPPYDFVARLVEKGPDGELRHIAARDGRVTVTSGDARLGGRFELVLVDGRTVTGTFAARTRG